MLSRCLALLQALATSSTRRQAGNMVRFGRFFPEDGKASLMSLIQAQEDADKAEAVARAREG